MYVVSIKGMVKQDQVFYYVTENDGQLSFIDRFEQAVQFDNDLEAKTWAKNNYLKLLQLLVDYRGPRIFNNSLAIRKIVFKTVQFINQDIFKEDGNVNSEGNNARDEVSNNDNLRDTELAEQSDADARETGSSDLQEVSE